MTYRLGLYEKALPPLSWEEKLRRLEWRPEQFAELRRAISEAGCPVHTMCLSGHRRFPLGSLDAATRQRALEIMRQALNFSVEAGIRIVQLAGYDVYYEDGCPETEKWFAENLAKCVEMAAESGVPLGFETMETPFMDTVRKAMRYVAANNSPYLGVYPDVGNLTNAALLYGGDVVEDLLAGRGHIFAAHLKETLPGVYRNLSFGQGHTGHADAAQALYGMGVRMFTGEFWYQGEADWRQNLRDAATFLRRQIEWAISKSGGAI